MYNSVFEKTIENVKKQRDIKLATANKKRNRLVSKPNYHIIKYFSEDLLVMEMKKIKVKINKPVYLHLSILDISKTMKYDSMYDYIKPKYQNNATLCFMDTDKFIIHVKTEDFYKDIAENIKKWFDRSNYSKDDKQPLPRGMSNNVTGLMKNELSGNIIIEFVALRPKTYSLLTDDDNNVQKAKGTKKCVIKRTLKFSDYKDCLFKNEIILKNNKDLKVTLTICILKKSIILH